MDQPDPMALLRALADDDRLRVVGMLALRPRDPADLALLLGITEASLEHHLRILQRAGLVRRTGGVCTLDVAPLRAVMAAAAAPREASPMIPEDASPETRRVLAAFFEGDRLVKIPSQRRKLLVVLEALAEAFEPDRTYAEREVNEILSQHHPDVASLRRAMVDEGIVERERGRYRRPSDSR
ncbi:MAG: DUF2087 domain-containing protein [Actinomycetota bacterium]